jgi:hypothetical protein
MFLMIEKNYYYIITIKPEYNDPQRDPKIVAVVDSRSLFRCFFTLNVENGTSK